jgi:hypothetical protein
VPILEELAKDFEEGREIEIGSTGKRTKPDQAEHKRKFLCFSDQCLNLFYF